MSSRRWVPFPAAPVGPFSSVVDSEQLIIVSPQSLSPTKSSVAKRSVVAAPPSTRYSPVAACLFGYHLGQGLVCTATGMPVSFALLEASHHGLTPAAQRFAHLQRQGRNSADGETRPLAENGTKSVPTRCKDLKEPNTLSEPFARNR